jgi:hypothetical protein
VKRERQQASPPPASLEPSVNEESGLVAEGSQQDESEYSSDEETDMDIEEDEALRIFEEVMARKNTTTQDVSFPD